METITFSPLLYKQRYQMVVELLEKYKPLKVADLGCAQCTLLSRLKFCNCIEVLVGVDTDLELLKENIIEHLDPTELARFPEVLFGYMNPAVVVITTPNADFNSLFPGLTHFRHCDHRFEWSRSEFQAWCLNIGQQYNYSVEFTGVGKGPSGAETLGFCTQISIFRRECVRATEDENSESPYKVVYEVAYPSLKDRKILHDAILNEVIFAAECMRRRFIDIDAGRQSGRRTWGADGGESAHVSRSLEVSRTSAHLDIPLRTFFTNPRVRQLSGSLQQLQEVLQGSDRVKLSHSGSSVLYPAGSENSKS